MTRVGGNEFPSVPGVLGARVTRLLNWHFQTCVVIQNRQDLVTVGWRGA